MAIFKLPKLQARQYTYIGFACALLGMLLMALAILAIFNLFGLGALPWFVSGALGVLSMLAATFAFHKMGTKKVAL